jgi:hypothetical protein
MKGAAFLGRKAAVSFEPRNPQLIMADSFDLGT